MGSPLPPHSLIFEKFEKSTAVPDMAPEPSFFVGTRENTETSRTRMQRRQQLRPNQPYISPPSHNSPTRFPFFFIPFLLLTRIWLSLLHPPPTTVTHPLHPLSPSHRYKTILTLI